MTDNICPHCGALLKKNAISCPECGSDEKTGWSDQASADWLLPDYDEIVANEFNEVPKKNQKIFIISIVLLIVFIITLLFVLL